MHSTTKRALDLLAVISLFIVLIIPLLILALVIKLTSRGPVLFWQKRMGIDNKVFNMPKFRTMRLDTPDVATNILQDPEDYITSIGSFLRKLSLDELPQLWSILKGDMSLVGPRPALYNQNDLIKLRTEKGIHKIVPGVTGWAQVNGRDKLTIAEKVEYDEYYMKNRSSLFDMKILIMTFGKVAKREGVSH